MKKKMLIGGLVVFLLAGMFVGCPDKPEEKEDKIAKEYQRKFELVGRTRYITLTKDKIIFSGKSFNEPETTDDTFTAWTNGNELWANIKRSYTENMSGSNKPNSYWEERIDYKVGTFTDVNTFVASIRQ